VTTPQLQMLSVRRWPRRRFGRGRGMGFRSLQEQVDTTTPGGKLVFYVFAALAEVERDSSAKA
jgi:Resolvase, N terminal domain